MTADWEITRAGPACSRCARALAPGDDHFSVLLDNKTEFVRQDVCPDCWNRSAPPECVGFWKTQVPRRDAKRKKFVDDDVIVNFFERCDGTDDPLKCNFRFVLGLVLLRKRLLKYENTVVEDGREYWSMKPAAGGEPVRVLNPRLTEEQITQVSEELGKILNTEV